MICGDDPTLPDLGGGCCVGADVYGPGRCTCWRPVHDLDQQPPDPQAARLTAAGFRPATRGRIGGRRVKSCWQLRATRQRNRGFTWRPHARPGDEHSQVGDGERVRGGSAEALEEFAATGAPFWCHQGMRRTTALRHPSGAEVPRGAAAFDPPIVDGIPYRADGRPGELCAGWAARRRALTADSEDA